jgi:hypothetical protein
LGTAYIFLTIIGAIFFYWLRCVQPLVYGLIEIAIACIVICIIFYPPDIYIVIEEPSAYGQVFRRAAGIVAGIYIFVRGMDNIERGLPLRWQSIWHNIFHRKFTHHNQPI